MSSRDIKAEGLLNTREKSPVRVNIVGCALAGQEAKPLSCTSGGLPSNWQQLKDCAVASVGQSPCISSVLFAHFGPVLHFK